MDKENLEQYFQNTWNLTVQKSKNSLDDDDRDTIDGFKTWKQLETWLQKNTHSTITMIRPDLSRLNVLVELILENLAPFVDAPLFWGSLACLLELVSKNLRSLEEVPRMIRSLAFKADTVNRHVKKAEGSRNAMSENAKNEVLFFIYVEFVEFFTSSIKYIHNTGSNTERRPVEQLIQQRSEIASVRLSELLSRLENLVDEPPVGEPASKDCAILPDIRTSHLFDRLDVFVKLDELLAPDAGDSFLQSVALHGIPGVGKTSVASSYAEKKRSQKAYNVILWVAGETDASLRQDFTKIAMRLKLPEARVDTPDENRDSVQGWFQTTDCKWLVIFDNVESAEILAPYWPRTSPRGRAIVTTRNRSLAFKPAASGLEIEHWDTDMGAEFLLFLLKSAVGQDLISETASARTLSQKVSGHALALLQVAGLIHNGAWSVQEWTDMYLEDPRVAQVNELANLWTYSFRTLEQNDKNSFTLLGILSFLMPDSIQGEILRPQTDHELPQDLGFLKGRIGVFSAALTKLTTLSLIKRDINSGVLTVHRLIQTQFRYFLSLEQRQKAFNDTITLISFVLPSSDSEKGQLYDTWEGYNRYLQHVLRLRDLFEEERKASTDFTAPQKFCEILNDYQRFLYEGFSFEECEKTCAVNRDAASTLIDEKDRVDIQGSIISHQAQVLEKLGDPQKAAIVCQQEIDMRLEESPKKQILLAYSTCNLGIIYSSCNDFPRALGAFQDSRRWWDAHFASKGKPQEFAPSISVSEARCIIGLGDFEKAEEMLNITVAKIKGEQPINFGTLAYAHFCFGILRRSQKKYDLAEACFIEAQNAWLEGGQARKHPFNAGILYNIGACCFDQGKTGASIKHLRDSLEVTKLYERTLPVENGRNYFKISEVLKVNGDDSAADAASARNKAEAYLRKKRPNITEMATESAYSDLIPVYWR